jgi:hypothetical protein
MSSFLSPADPSYWHLFSAVFHLPNFLECAGRYGIAGRFAQSSSIAASLTVVSALL